MPVNPITSSSAASLLSAATATVPVQNPSESPTQANSVQAQSGNSPDSDAKSETGTHSSSSTPNALKTIAHRLIKTNSDGTETVTVTYTDGTTSKQVKANPTPTVSQSPLASQGGQLSTLLKAQEQARQGV